MSRGAWHDGMPRKAYRLAAAAVRGAIIGRPCCRPPGVNGPRALEVEAAQVVVHAAQPEPAAVAHRSCLLCCDYSAHDACAQRLDGLASIYLSLETLLHCPHKPVPLVATCSRDKMEQRRAMSNSTAVVGNPS